MHDTAGLHPFETVVTRDETLERQFEERMRDSAALAVRVAYGVLRQRSDAEDVAQEAFARAYRRFERLRDRAAFRAWIVRTAWRLAIDRWRADRRRLTRELRAVPATAAANVEEVAAGNERAERLWRAIDALPEKLRLVIVLCAIEGHDVAEVGRLLRIPAGTVKSRLFLARSELARSLQCLA
jgi:RNA polymerase sigma-70 factor (ECF subfamily)